MLLSSGSVRTGKLLNYTIVSFSRLDPLLGKNWHIRGLNKQLDFCYVHLETIQYCLHRRHGIRTISPEGTQLLPGGYIVVFKFVRVDRVWQQWDSLN